MTSATDLFQVGAVPLGYVGVVASWRRPTALAGGRYHGQLIIQSCSSTDEGVHEPAQSIAIYTVEGHMALRGAIDEALRAPSEEPTP